ncbi:MAG TPA: hypothetical protein VFE47_16220 [Tepidisphaeraceae bacterium]|jgi:hypothetical protein|nr:hypothetical protein [Tepidisphaeraceae bacterium]
MNSKTAILASPLLCLGVLTVIAADNARHVTPEEAEPYHQRAKAAIEAFPYVIRSSSGNDTWTGNDETVPEAAVKLLRPNALVSRRYTNHPADGRGAQWADLLISQCKDSRDMTGHYPPICYPSNGERNLGSRSFHLKAGDTWIDGTEYQFKAKPDQGCDRKSVYNFFVVPGRGIVPDISGVRSAAGDYQRRYYGAAQFQVVLDADQPAEVRDDVFTTLIGSDAGILRTLGTAK